MALDFVSACARGEASAPSLSWKTGAMLPPFLAANVDVMKLLAALLAGGVDSVPAVEISEAVAVMVYRAVFDAEAKSEQLDGVGMNGVYTILASLKYGMRVTPPRAARGEAAATDPATA